MIRNSEHVMGEVAIAVLASLLILRFFIRAWRKPPSPDPWDQETEKALHEPEAVEVCHRCFAPVSPCSWFCEHCGCAVGPYNNLMPYIEVFSEGEVLRNGVNDRFRQNALVVAGYFLVSLHLYVVFAPIYWILFLRNLNRQKEGVEPIPTHSS